MDDAENLLSEQSRRETEEQERQNARRQPWSADWAKELAGLLSRRHVPLSAVYVLTSQSHTDTTA